MEQTDFFSFLTFTLINTITPGPNNLTLLAYGKYFGYNGAIKIIIGILLGLSFLLIVCGVGIINIISLNENIEFTLKAICSIYILFISFIFKKISISSKPKKIKKLGLKEMFFLQFVNPKGWIMCISSAGVFLPNLLKIGYFWGLIIFVGVHILFGFPSALLWLFFGDSLSKIFKSKKSNDIVSWVIFLLMVFSVLLIWI